MPSETKSKKLFKNMIIYFIGNVSTKLIAFFMLPLYTNLVSPYDFGYYDWIQTIMYVAIPMLFIEVWNGILRFMYDKQDIKGKYSIITNGLLLTFISIVIYFIAFAIATNFIDIKHPILVALYGSLYSLQFIFQYAARGLGKNTVFMVSGVVCSFVNIISNIILIAGFKMGLSALLISYCLGMFASIIVVELGAGIIHKNQSWKPDRIILRKMFIYCAPLLINTVPYWFLASYNRFAIIKYLGEEQNGVFAAAVRIGVVLTLITTVFNMAWQEAAYEVSYSSGRSDYYSKMLNNYIKVLVCGMLILLPVISIAFSFFVGSDYSGAKPLLPLYFLAATFSAVSGFFGQLFEAEKKTNIIFISTLIGGTVSVVSVHLLIHSYGLQSAAISMILGFGVNIFIRMILIQKSVKVSLNYRFILLSLAAFVGVCYSFYKGGFIINLMVAAVAVLLSLYLCWDIVSGIIKGIRIGKR